MEKIKNYDSLWSNRFMINLPSELGIDHFEISSAVIEKDKLLIQVKDKIKGSVYNKFRSIEEVNEKIGDKSIIEVCYLDKTGKTIRSERYTDVKYVSFARTPIILDYNNCEPLKYLMEFTFNEILVTDIRN